MGPLVGITAALALIGYLGFSAGLIDFFFPPAAPQASASHSSLEPGSAVLPFSFPIPYSATVQQSGDGIAQPRVRFYVAKSTKEAK